MIQRKQTLFFFVALVLTLLCLCMPVGYITPQGMGTDMIIYNLGVRGIDIAGYTGWPLMILLLVACSLCAVTIFLYHNRRLQMRLCVWMEVLYAAWYIYLLWPVFHVFGMIGSFRANWTTCLPFISIVLCMMAHHAIKKDEDLVRSADRIR